jgi:DNA polymerase I-like protein with 3'-5' exonuclease and polymerase domains/uracil-DNA glycosylase
LKIITHEIPIPKHLEGIRVYNLGIPVVETRSQNRVLFVFDEPHKDEMQRKSLVSGCHGDLFINLVRKAKSTFLKPELRKDFTWSAINFVNGPIPNPEVKRDCYAFYQQRLESYIKKFKPTSIVFFGNKALRSIGASELPNLEAYSKHLGGMVSLTTKGVTYKAFPTINLLDILRDTGEDGLANILGIICTHIANGIAGDIQFKINAKRISNAEIILIDTIKRFDKMMGILEAAPCYACDTETDSLNKVRVKMLTMQFAVSEDRAFILPFYHKDTPFSGKELTYIKTRLQAFFEKKGNAKYAIYHNGTFDLNVIRNNCEVRYFPTNIWDTIAGEFALDENWKYITGAPMVNYKPYKLDNVAIRYHFHEYGKSTITKGDSKNIANMSLSDPNVQRYMAFDVTTIFAIHRKQLERATMLGYNKFKSVVTEQISDLIHCFSTMNQNGNLIDVDYLLYLNSPESPVLTELKIMEDRINHSDAAKKVNAVLCKDANIPTRGLFGKVNLWLFDIHKPQHKGMFFFDALGLKPLAFGKSKNKAGKPMGKVNKAFQSKYKEHPGVKVFTALSKAEKLRNSFIRSFLKLLKLDPDFKSDQCIRPSIDFKGVVTGRVAERDPNCQQIPQRTELGKHIKRLFIAELGWLYIKVDYSAHEVRGLSLISRDTVLAEVFMTGARLRKRYKNKPSEELAREIELKGDVHKLNVAFFFSKNLETIAKDLLKLLRDQIKGVVFGLIYGKGNKTLARDLDKEESFVKDLVDRFFARFIKSGKWLINVEEFAKKNHYSESPLGRRRNLFAYLLPSSFEHARALWGAMNRRARNAPIQGMGSDFGFMGARIMIRRAFERAKEIGEIIFKLQNMVHDSSETVCRLDNFMFGIRMVEEALTQGVKEETKRRHNFDFVVDLEIDMEIGPNLRDLKKWDGRLTELIRIIAWSLEFQRQKMGYAIQPIEKTLKHLLTKQVVDMPEYLQRQLKDQGIPDLPAIIKEARKQVKAYELI